MKTKGRSVTEQDGVYELREPATPDKGVFMAENGLLRPENTHFGDELH